MEEAWTAVAERLSEPFDADELEWRVQTAGEKNGRTWCLVVPYVTNRAIQARLDTVVGAGHWWNAFAPSPGGGVLCGITLRVEEREVTKWDGSGTTDVEGEKGILSAAMKRAAVQWGIGRYLYALDEAFGTVHENGAYRGKTRDGKAFRWDPPELPAWAIPVRRSAVAREHEAMLDWVRTEGARAHDEAAFTIAGAERSVKEYIRENWPAMKEQYRIARAVVEALEPVVGSKFFPPR